MTKRRDSRRLIHHRHDRAPERMSQNVRIMRHDEFARDMLRVGHRAGQTGGQRIGHLRRENEVARSGGDGRCGQLAR